MSPSANETRQSPRPQITFVAAGQDAKATPRASALILTELIDRLGLSPLLNELEMGKESGVEVEDVVLTYLLMSSYGAKSVKDLVEQVQEDTSLAAILGDIEKITDRVIGYYNKLHEVGTMEELLDQFLGRAQKAGRFASRKDGVIATDDCTMRKFGKTMEHIAVVYDHCDKLYYLGYVMVSTCYGDATKAYPK